MYIKPTRNSHKQVCYKQYQCTFIYTNSISHVVTLYLNSLHLFGTIHKCIIITSH